MFGIFRKKQPSKPDVAVRLKGDGSFSVSIVGESFYQSELEGIAGKKSSTAKEHRCGAFLICETSNPYDQNAVAIEIDGQKVGHLSKQDAKRFRAWLTRYDPRLPDAFAEAIVVGGWKDRDGEGHFGVRLDIAGFEKL